MDRRQFTASALALGAVPLLGADPSPLLTHIVGGRQRTPANVARDRFRHPAKSLAFWGLAPGMTVVEIEPSGGYWTEILAPYLKVTHGRYVAAVGEEGADAFKARFSDPAAWGHVEMVDFSGTSGPLVGNGAADLVLTARNFHNWMWEPGLTDKVLADFHAALAPHQILALEEHRADPRPMVPGAPDGYVSTAYLTNAVEAAGFTLEASSEINANWQDTKDYPFGVWTLPPTRRTHARGQATPADFDPDKYEKIGESDRMTLRFRRA